MENNLKNQHYKNMSIKPQMEILTFEAESVAYVVCKYFGLDTSDYSFGYIAGWSSGRETKELKASLETIREASNSMIDQASAVLEKARAAKQPLEQTVKAVQGRCM